MRTMGGDTALRVAEMSQAYSRMSVSESSLKAAGCNADLQEAMPELAVGDSPTLAKCQTPALQTPAADVEYTRDDGVSVHFMSNVEIGHFDSGD